jgi:TonB family protein
MITYVFKSSLSLITLFGLYWFLLRKEKLFVFNRFFLVVSVVFSLIVPFISIPVNFRVTPQLEDIISSNDYITTEILTPGSSSVPSDVYGDKAYVQNRPATINFSAILLALYISGVIVFLIRFLRNIYLIAQKIRISEKISFEGYWIVLTNDKTGPCCFSNSVFLNKDDYLKGRIARELLDHELEHVKQSHTIDIMLIELLKIFYWFNPVHILYDRAVRINHEYLADNGVISYDYNVENYACKLLSFITGRNNLSLTSGSTYSFTKMRLMMMTKPRSGSSIYGSKIATTLCLGIVLFLSLSFKESDKLTLKSGLSDKVTEMTQNIVRGIVMTDDGKPLFGVKISASDNPATEISDKEGRFLLEDVREGALLEFSLQGYKPYYLSTSFEVAFNIELTIELRKDNIREKDDIYAKAEIMPQYPGGDAELRKFIVTNVNYPEAVIEQKAKGTVIVRFVVNKKGNIEDVEILHRVHPALDAEVLRVIGKLGQFTPGSQGGKPVDVYYTVPVTFVF